MARPQCLGRSGALRGGGAAPCSVVCALRRFASACRCTSPSACVRQKAHPTLTAALHRCTLRPARERPSSLRAPTGGCIDRARCGATCNRRRLSILSILSAVVRQQSAAATRDAAAATSRACVGADLVLHVACCVLLRVACCVTGPSRALRRSRPSVVSMSSAPPPATADRLPGFRAERSQHCEQTALCDQSFPISAYNATCNVQQRAAYNANCNVHITCNVQRAYHV